MHKYQESLVNTQQLCVYEGAWRKNQLTFSVKCMFIYGYTQPEIQCLIIKFLVQITST